MHNQPPNPYINLTAIRNPDMFFGRVDPLRRFYGAISNRQSVAVFGSRHIGKSSFLLCASLPEIQESFDFDLSHHIFVYIDLREYLHKTSEDFFRAVSKGILKQCPDSLQVQLQSEENGEDAFQNLLEQIVEEDFFPVLLLDAFDNITLNEHFDPEFFAFLRSQASGGKISYVTASVAPLPEVCHHGVADSPFFNIFDNYRLGPFTLEEAQDLVTIPSEKADLPFTEEECHWILHMAGRHPFFIQRVCYALFEEKLSASTSHIKRTKKMIYQDLQPHFQHTWDRLSEKFRSLLQDEAQKKVNEERELPELSESAFFRQFVRDTCRAKLFKMEPEELERALDNLDDARELGKTDLRLLNLVFRRLKEVEHPSSVEKGMAIRTVLNEAFERLRGSAIRSDGNPALLLYNILHYRYFKKDHSIKNEHIAARLGMSVRQYFRYRSKAIEALLIVLFEMENASTGDVDE